MKGLLPNKIKFVTYITYDKLEVIFLILEEQKKLTKKALQLINDIKLQKARWDRQLASHSRTRQRELNRS